MEQLEEWLSQQGLGTRLRAMRAQAGLSGKGMADALGWAQSKVSRIESGKQMPSVEDIEAWVNVTSANVDSVPDLLARREEAQVLHATFKGRMKQGQEVVQRSYTDLVERSSLIRHYENVFVPGPLQVPGYARRILDEMIPLHNLEIDDVDAAVAERMRRQQFLYDPAKRWEFLVAEPVLRWLLPSPAVMRAQLDRLQTVIGVDHIRFGIIPMGVRLASTPQDSVEIYAGDETLAVAETFIGETWHRDEEAEAYGRAIDRLWKDAVEGEDARELIFRAVQALPAEAGVREG
jgi:transcriptional regulator with XRE-family HTH domain